MHHSAGRRFFVAVGLVLAGFGATGWAGDIAVPGDFPTIQLAIDAAMDGDTICVSDGTYNENLNFLGKAITVKSVAGPDVTIIDGGAVSSVVVFNGGESASSVLEGFTITNGNAVDGGGILCLESFPTIINNTISGNIASNYGGGISFLSYADLGTVSGAVQGNTISNNSAGVGGAGFNAGGGIFAYSTYDFLPVFSGNTIINNSAVGATAWGGGLYASTFNYTYGGAAAQDNAIVVSNNTLSGNTATSPGGGLVTYGGSQTVTGNTLLNNSSSGPGGGGWVYSYYGPVTVAEGTISGNTGLEGGGLYLGSGVGITVSNTTVSGNTATGPGGYGSAGGGGLYAYGGVQTLTNNLIVNNTTTYDGGGAVLAYAQELTIENSTISGNTADQASAGGLFIYSFYPSVVRNSILWNNSALSNPEMYSYGAITADFSIVEGGGFPGTGSLDEDPLFVSGPGGDFFLSHIAAGDGVDSPAVDAGDPMSLVIDGTTRTDGVLDVDVVDMGFHAPSAPFLRGDADGDGNVNGLVDGIFILSFQFVMGSPAPPCDDAADVDDDGSFNGLVDGLFVLNFQFFPGSPPPPDPGPTTCGVDPTVDGLGCATAQASCP